MVDLKVLLRDADLATVLREGARTARVLMAVVEAIRKARPNRTRTIWNFSVSYRAKVCCCGRGPTSCAAATRARGNPPERPLAAPSFGCCAARPMAAQPPLRRSFDRAMGL